MKLSPRAMSTSLQLWLGFGVLTLVLALVCLVVLWRLMVLRNAVEDMAAVNRLRTGTAVRLADYLNSYTNAVREFAIDRRESDRMRAQRRAQSVEAVLADYREDVAAGVETEAELDVLSGWTGFQQLGTRLLSDAAQPEAATAETLRQFIDRSLMLQSRVKTELLTSERGAYDTRKNAAITGLNTILRFAAMLLCIGLLVAIGTSYAVGRSVINDQQNLAAAEEQLRTTLGSIGDAVLTISQTGEIAALNLSAEQLMGWSAEEAIGQRWSTVVTLKSRQQERTDASLIREALERGQSATFQESTVLVTRAGEERAVDVHVSPVRNSTGQRDGAVLVFRDVSERRQQEAALKGRALLTSIRADVSASLASSLDTQSVLVQCCVALRTHLNAKSVAIWRSSEAEGEWQLQAAVGENADHLQKLLSLDTLPSGVDVRLNSAEVCEVPTVQLRNGTETDSEQEQSIVTAFPLFVEGRAFGILGIESAESLPPLLRQGLTPKGEAIAQYLQRKESEAKLRERELRYRLIGQAANDVIWDWDLLTDLVEWNEGVTTRFGYSPEQVGATAQWWYDMIHPEDAARVTGGIKQAIKIGQEIWQDEYRYRRADGSYADVFDRGRVVFQDGRAVRMVGAMFDLTDRKRAEQALRESEERVRLAVEAANIGTWDFDLVQNRLDWSERCKAIFGLPSDAEITYDVFLERLHPDDREAVDLIVQDSIAPAGNGSYEVDYRVCWPDGTIRWVIARGQCVFADEAAGRAPVRFSGTVLDITDRKLIEQALQDSEEKFRDLADNISQFAWMADEKGWIFWYNKRWFEYTGTTLEEMQGWGWQSVHHPDHLERVVEKLQRSWDTGIPWEDTFPLRSKDGEYRWFLSRAQPILNEQGQIVRWFGTNTDIEELKRSEAAARRRSEQVRRLAGVATRLGIAHDVTSVAGIVTREAHLIVDANRARMDLWLQGRDKPVQCFASSSEREATESGPSASSWEAALITDVSENNAPLRLNFEQLQTRFPEAEPLNGWMAAPLVDRHGRNLGGLSLTRSEPGEFSADDEAVLVQLAQMTSVAIENARLFENLQQNDRRKDEFLATLAHELRNPLAPIRTGLEVLRVSDNDPETLEEVRGIMERQTQQLVTLVDDLLDVSRITRGKMELRKCEVRLREVARNAIDTARPLIDEAGHRLIESFPDQPITLFVDPHRFAQILSNLLNNAAKYTPDGGTIEFKGELDGDTAVIRIRDSGVGIPAEMRSQIFEMFAQIDRPHEKVSTGLGIGLTLVKSLVEMHDGTVEVLSEGANRGSEFIVRLPVFAANKEAAGEQEGASAVSPPRPSRKVLIVDDNRAAAEMLKIVIQILGNDVKIAHDGQEGVNVAESFRPDVILMDLGMPIMTGYEATRLIREQEWGQEIIIIALTGWGQEEDRQRTRDAGFNHHLVKPAEPAELQALLADI